MRARASEGGGKNGEMRRCTCGMLDDTKGLRWSWAARKVVMGRSSLQTNQSTYATLTWPQTQVTETKTQTQVTETQTQTQTRTSAAPRFFAGNTNGSNSMAMPARTRIVAGVPAQLLVALLPRTLGLVTMIQHDPPCKSMCVCAFACEDMWVWPRGSNEVWKQPQTHRPRTLRRTLRLS